MQDIDKELSRMYDFNIDKIYPLKNYYIIETSEGKKVLKNINCSPERIMFVHGAKEHLYNNGFKNIDRYVCNKAKSPVLSINGELYTVSDAVEGRECDFNSREDVIRASKMLAMLHKASKGYIPPQNSIARDDLGKLPEYFNKRLEEIKRTKKMAQRERGKFDYLILEYIDYFYELGENALERIHNSMYFDVVKKSREDRLFCHHDYTHCNIICKDTETSVINFEYCSFELKVYDVANLLRRKMRKCNWDIDEAMVIIDAYTSIEPISKDEFEILKIMLQFPQKFWRVVNRHYNSRRIRREKSFAARFNEVIEEIEYHKKFLNEFNKI
ncbi:MAG TPA: CotS family spore coat protein [Acetivibrio sp.]|uniref:CotS family spore coat protein n=1 Tax=Acetivibrio sp. TaxID=1872092 RepID=UPI002B5339BB|nr:CotS family spore coat protein [Acetivibrio sp.]HOM02661.1 CotS family spore coat protein [Acetivibrio sp.]